MYLALIPVTYTPLCLLAYIPQLIHLSSYLTKPDSIIQSLTHALIKLLPGVGVGFPMNLEVCI
jgi:hypothetical protein